MQEQQRLAALEDAQAIAAELGISQEANRVMAKRIQKEENLAKEKAVAAEEAARQAEE